MSSTTDMSLAGIMESSETNTYSKDILKEFQWAIKRVNNETKDNNDEATQLTQDELIQLI